MATQDRTNLEPQSADRQVGVPQSLAAIPVQTWTYFVRESWEIEDIFLAEPTLTSVIQLHREWVAHWLRVGTITAIDVEQIAYEITSGKGRLRCLAAMDVEVGEHIPPAGGPAVVAEFEDLCRDAHTLHPYILHQRFEQLHPLMDGNGRVGRLLWLWRMIQFGEAECVVRHQFLRQWYYQSLEHWRAD